MKLTFSLLFLAAGAILRYAVDAHQWSDINAHTAGAVLMVVGAIGLVISLLAMLIVGAAVSVAKTQPRKPLR